MLRLTASSVPEPSRTSYRPGSPLTRKASTTGTTGPTGRFEANTLHTHHACASHTTSRPPQPPQPTSVQPTPDGRRPVRRRPHPFSTPPPFHLPLTSTPNDSPRGRSGAHITTNPGLLSLDLPRLAPPPAKPRPRSLLFLEVVQLGLPLHVRARLSVPHERAAPRRALVVPLPQRPVLPALELLAGKPQ